MITKEIELLSEVIEKRIKYKSDFNIGELTFPEVDTSTNYGQFVSDHHLSNAERLLLIIAIVPNISPYYFYDAFDAYYHYTYTDKSNAMRVKCPEHLSGVIKSPNSDTFLASGYTFLYLWCGQNVSHRIEMMSKITTNQLPLIVNENVLTLTSTNNLDPLMAGALVVNPELLINIVLK